MPEAFPHGKTVEGELGLKESTEDRPGCAPAEHAAPAAAVSFEQIEIGSQTCGASRRVKSPKVTAVLSRWRDRAAALVVAQARVVVGPVHASPAISKMPHSSRPWPHEPLHSSMGPRGWPRDAGPGSRGSASASREAHGPRRDGLAQLALHGGQIVLGRRLLEGPLAMT